MKFVRNVTKHNGNVLMKICENIIRKRWKWKWLEDKNKEGYKSEKLDGDVCLREREGERERRGGGER